ncbi:arsenite methyltransferase [bacterium]|nr:arsenite methyltransferase [bacterium]
MRDRDVKEFVRAQYAQVASADSLCCPGCVCPRNPYEQARAIGYSEEELSSLPRTAAMGLGCGNPVAFATLKEGEKVLDLGCGGGLDCFLAARKVGDDGLVIGVDMTQGMIDRAVEAARRHGYVNVEFRVGDMESLPVDPESIDAVISNCSINLCPDKCAAYREAFRVLKPGGRIVISDLVTEGTLPEDLRTSLKAWAECIGGTVQRHEYLDVVRKAGFENVRVLSERHFEHLDSEIGARIVSMVIGASKAMKYR